VAIGRMLLWSWILFVVFLLVAVILGPVLGSSGSALTVPVVGVFVVASRRLCTGCTSACGSFETATRAC
jgi:hypothetical protein